MLRGIKTAIVSNITISTHLFLFTHLYEMRLPILCLHGSLPIFNSRISARCDEQRDYQTQTYCYFNSHISERCDSSVEFKESSKRCDFNSRICVRCYRRKIRCFNNFNISTHAPSARYYFILYLFKEAFIMHFNSCISVRCDNVGIEPAT